MDDSVYELYEAFLVDPTSTAYRRVRRSLISSPVWSHSSQPLLEASELIKKGCSECAEELLDRLVPHWLLSPRWHFLKEQIAGSQLSNHHDHRFQLHACLKGMLRTGDGSPAAPFLVTYVTDPLDILWGLQLTPSFSQFVRSDDGMLEVVTCDDGGEVWFHGDCFADGRVPVLELNSALGTVTSGGLSESPTWTWN